MAVFNRIRLGGGLYGSERWSTHLDITLDRTASGGAAQGGVDALKTWADNIVASALTNAHDNALGELLSLNGTLTDVRVEYISAGVVIEAAEATTAEVGVGSGSKAFQTACVISLQTARAGASYRGRVYWPAIGAVTGTSGRMTAPTTANVAARYVALANDIIGALPSTPTDPGLCVYSPKLDAVTPVTSVSVGDVLDSQRRRRDKLIENRATVVIP